MIAGHAEESTSGEFEERKKAWKSCNCPIFAVPSINKSRRRKSTGEWEWEAAKTVARQWETSHTWSATPALPEPKRERITIEKATEDYLDWHRSHHIQKSSLNRYKTLTNLLLAFTSRKDITYIDQLTISDMDSFYNSWKDAMRSRAKKLERLKSFVRFCLKPASRFSTAKRCGESSPTPVS